MAFSTLFLDASSGSGTMDGIKDMVSDLSQTIGVDLFEEDIDNVVFQTNEFLCNSDVIGSQGPFLVDFADEYGFGSIVLYHRGWRHGLQDDGEE